MKKDKVTVKLNAEVIASHTDYKDMSRYAHIAIYVDDKLIDVLIEKIEM